MTNDDGGPAFPITHVNPVQWAGQTIPGMKGKEGMTLRDWFAGMALMNMDAKVYADPAVMAEDAFRIADAMLEARKK